MLFSPAGGEVLDALGPGPQHTYRVNFLFLRMGRCIVELLVSVWFPRAPLQDAQNSILIHTFMKTKLVTLTPTTFWEGR